MSRVWGPAHSPADARGDGDDAVSRTRVRLVRRVRRDRWRPGALAMPTPRCVVPSVTRTCRVVQILTSPSCVLHNLIPSPVFYRSSPHCVLHIAILLAVLYGSPIPVYYPPCVLPSDDMTKIATASPRKSAASLTPVMTTRPIAGPGWPAGRLCEFRCHSSSHSSWARIPRAIEHRLLSCRFRQISVG